MIRSSVYHLVTTHSPARVASAVAKPAAAVLSARSFSMKPKRDEDFVNKNYSDAFDESDALEKGKEEHDVEHKPTSVTRHHALGRRFPFESPLMRHPFFAGFGDDFFTRDPFFSRHDRDFFKDPFTDTRIMPVLRNFPSGSTQTLLRSSPGYEIKESDASYEINIDVPEGLTASDMKVELEQDGTLLHLSGEHKVEENNRVTHTRFDKHFGIGPNIDVEKLSANLSDGVLVVKAPKLEVDTDKQAKQTIAITETPHEFTDEEVRQKTFSDEFDESDFAETGKKEH